jgi:hypothetical protein
VNPNSRSFVGIDVAKDRLDVHVRPSGDTFALACDGEGVAALVERLRAAIPQLIVLEATGGFEQVVAAQRDFVHWRFSDAGLGAAARHPSPASENLHKSGLMHRSKKSTSNVGFERASVRSLSTRCAGYTKESLAPGLSTTHARRYG